MRLAADLAQVGGGHRLDGAVRAGVAVEPLASMRSKGWPAAASRRASGLRWGIEPVPPWTAEERRPRPVRLDRTSDVSRGRRPASIRRGERSIVGAWKTGRAAAAPSSCSIAGDELRRDQRGDAEVEEVVVDADRLDAEHPLPDRASRRLEACAARRLVVRVRAPRRGAGSALRSILPFGVSGNASSTTKRRRAPCTSGSARAR